MMNKIKTTMALRDLCLEIGEVDVLMIQLTLYPEELLEVNLEQDIEGSHFKKKATEEEETLQDIEEEQMLKVGIEAEETFQDIEAEVIQKVGKEAEDNSKQDK
jgi:hypothetical protein